jgi:hypothetical protein
MLLGVGALLGFWGTYWALIPVTNTNGNYVMHRAQPIYTT